MPKRPLVTAKRFGEWLEALRGEHSLEQIALRLRPLVKDAGLKVDRSLIKKLEQGRLPNWPMIGALAHVYGVSIADTLARLAAAVEFPGAQRLFGRDIEAAEIDDPRALQMRDLEHAATSYGRVIARAKAVLDGVELIDDKSTELAVRLSRLSAPRRMEMELLIARAESAEAPAPVGKAMTDKN